MLGKFPTTSAAPGSRSARQSSAATSRARISGSANGSCGECGATRDSPGNGSLRLPLRKNERWIAFSVSVTFTCRRPAVATTSASVPVSRSSGGYATRTGSAASYSISVTKRRSSPGCTGNAAKPRSTNACVSSTSRSPRRS